MANAAIVAHSTTHQEDRVQRMGQNVKTVASLATGSLFVVPALCTQHKQQQGIHALDATEPDTKFPTAPSGTLHMQDTPQLFFHSRCIDSIFETDTFNPSKDRSGRGSRHNAPAMQD